LAAHATARAMLINSLKVSWTSPRARRLTTRNYRGQRKTQLRYRWDGWGDAREERRERRSCRRNDGARSPARPPKRGTGKTDGAAVAASRFKPEFPPLLSAGLHRFDAVGLQRLTVRNFAASVSRQRLWDNFKRLVIDKITRVGLSCEIWLNGSFLTHKIDPNDVDFVVDVPINSWQHATHHQAALLYQYSAMAFPASDVLHSFVMYNTPPGHPMESGAIAIHRQWERDFGTAYPAFATKPSLDSEI